MNQLPTLHSTYYSIVIGYVLFGLVPILRTSLWGYDIHYSWIEDITFKIVIVKVLLLSYHVIWLSLVMSIRWLIGYWLNDYYVEFIIGITLLEQSSLSIGSNLLTFSELMLFVGGFGTWFNLMFNINPLYSLNSYPIFNYFTSSLGFSNLSISIFSSFSIQSCIIYHCYGYLRSAMETLGQTVSIGYISLIVQLKEFLYSYYSISDSMIGSIFYLTVTPHGSHVSIGLFRLYMPWFLYFYSIITSSSYILSGLLPTSFPLRSHS